MKVFVLAPPSPLRQALTQVFNQRGRAHQFLSVTELAAEDCQGALIIDAENLAAQAGGDLVDLPQRKALWRAKSNEGALIILLSDARVFDGGDTPQFSESHEPCPASRIGGQLLAFEQVFQEVVAEPIILRSGVLFDAQGENLLRHLVRSLGRGERLAVSNKLKSAPTYTADFARVLAAMIDQLQCAAPGRGVYHYNGAGATTAFEFAEVVYAHAAQQVDMAAARPDLFADDAGVGLEPRLPVLRCERILSHFGVQQLPWRSFVPRLVKQLCEEGSK